MFKKFKKIFGKSNKSKKVAPTTNDTATTATPTATATPTETTVVVASTITPTSPTETTTTSPINIRDNLNAIIKGIQEGRILEVFDKYYAESIEMFEGGDSTGRIGKVANRKAEEYFVANAVIQEAKVLKIIVDGNSSAYEMLMKFTFSGTPVEKTQWALQTWENGLIVKEEFNESNKTPVTPTVVEVAPINIRDNLNEIIKGIQEGRILEVFDKYYAESIVMSENGDSTGRVGKELNRKAEEGFVTNAVIEEAKVLKTIVDGNNSAYEMFMKFTYAGHPVEKTQWALQTWENGLIVKEEFNESNKKPVAPVAEEVKSE